MPHTAYLPIVRRAVETGTGPPALLAWLRRRYDGGPVDLPALAAEVGRLVEQHLRRRSDTVVVSRAETVIVPWPRPDGG